MQFKLHVSTRIAQSVRNRRINNLNFVFCIKSVQLRTANTRKQWFITILLCFITCEYYPLTP